ncbi:MAG: glucuronate isomerase [Limisphaerales bacterium]
MKFIHENFLLHNRTARRFYQEYAEPEPIFDYHCHLPPRDIADDRQFKNLAEIWLEGDHYKWRAMRANGVEEKYCTGNAKPEEKFRAWAATVPHTLRNPLYHWTHLELKRYFGIDEALNEESASRVWRRANEQLAGPELSARGILRKFKVTALCTTDDPTDDLASHKKIADDGLATRVFPAFRPDKALAVHHPYEFNKWFKRLEQSMGGEIGTFSDFVAALRNRHDYFHAHGCRLSDHGLSQCLASPCPAKTAAAIFAKARRGQVVSPEECAQFGTHLMLWFGRWDAEKGWVKQLHLGALRNNNSRMLRQLGPDTGFDCMGDFPQAQALVQYLDLLDRNGHLPKMIVYSNNPADNYLCASVVGCFQDGALASKMQFGSAWWFLDQKEGIEWQLNALSNIGLLSRFVGMITDSRSFMSYPRHEYFRRVLCNLIGREAESGDLPNDEALLGPMIRNICYSNARQYLALPEAGTAPAAVSRTKGAPRAMRQPAV